MPALSSSYARLTAVHPALRVITGQARSGAGWTAAHDLAAGGAAVAGFVAREAGRLAAEHGSPPRPEVAATLALHRYLWPACLLFTVPWFLRRRVPLLPVDAVSLHRASGTMAVRPRGILCLPGDSAARLPGARVVPTEEALRAELRTALADHLSPLLAAFRPMLRRGPHALWGMATDEVTEGLWYVATLLGEAEERRARADLAALLPGGTPPFAGAAGFHRPPRSGADVSSTALPATETDAQEHRPASRRTRLTCCLFYTLSADDSCAGCPRTCGPARNRRPAYAA